MSNIIQNVKSGFVNMKELFGILLNSDEEEISDDYDLYINGNDASIAKTAEQLKELEKEQEEKRMSILGLDIPKRVTRKKDNKSN